MNLLRYGLGYFRSAAAGLLMAGLFTASLSANGSEAGKTEAEAVEDSVQPDVTEIEKSPPRFHLDSGKLFSFYRFADDGRSRVTANRLDYKLAFKTGFSILNSDRLSLHTGVFSGSSFIGSLNGTGLGSPEFSTQISLKQLYLRALPADWLSIQYGYLYLLRGRASEITTYDNDGYIAGQRLVVSKPNRLFFDILSVTAGYLGDLHSPGIQDRLSGLAKSNYYQLMVEKSLNPRLAFSADYTSQWGIGTMREAVTINQPVPGINRVVLEAYHRLEGDEASGFAVQAEKLLSPRFRIGAGYASIDRGYGWLNADRFQTGNRLFVEGSAKLGKGFSVATFLGRAVANDYLPRNRTRFDLLLIYDVGRLMPPAISR